MLREDENIGPLTGVRVLDLTINVLGPVATQILGDLGAEVIKVETPSGDPMRLIGSSKTGMLGPFFQTTNRNKKSVVLDLKKIEEKNALLKIAGGCDVFVHNMRQAATERLGIDYKNLRKSLLFFRDLLLSAVFLARARLALVPQLHPRLKHLPQRRALLQMHHSHSQLEVT